MADNIVGNVGVSVTPDATDFWNRFVQQTRPGAVRAGEDLGKNVRRGVQGEMDRGVDIKVRADTAAAQTQIAALNQNVSRNSGGMLKNLLALAPALIPLGGAAAAAGSEFAVLGATGVLALTGIKREIAASSPIGLKYAGIVGQLKDNLHQLQATASVGVLSGFADAQSKLSAEMPQVNKVIADQSILLGSAASHLTGGLVGGFRTFAPVLMQVSQSVDRVAAKFETFATGPGGQKFAATLSKDYAIVAPIIDDIAKSLVHVVGAGEGIGIGLVSSFGLFARVLSTFPTQVLQAIIDGFVVFRTAAAVSGVVNAISASFASLGARVALPGLRAKAAATQATAAAAQVSAASAAEASAVAAAQATVAEAYAASTRATAIAAVGSEAALSGLALAAVAAADTQAAAAASAATAAAASAERQAAAAEAAALAQRAAATQAAVASRTASAGFASSLGPLGLLAGGLLLLGSSFGSSKAKTDAAAGALENYTSALKESNGAINDSVRASVAKVLGDTGALATAQKLGISQSTLTQTVLDGEPAVRKLVGGFAALATAHGVSITDTAGLTNVLLKQAGTLADAQKAAKDYEAALLGIGSANSASGRAVLNSNAAIQTLIDSYNTFAKSEGNAADKGALIGSILRASNGPAIAYGQAMSGVAGAAQQLVTDLQNVKNGIVDVNTGAINFHRAGSAQLFTDLAGVQDAAVKAASATYQLEVGTKGSTTAAQDAYDVYQKSTKGFLVDNADKFNIGAKAAKGMADKYFTIKNAKDIRKVIQLAAHDKVTDLLASILRVLKVIAGNPFVVTIDADISPFNAKIQQANHDLITLNSAGNVSSRTKPGGLTAYADGGFVTAGTGPRADDVLVRVSKGEAVIPADQTAKHHGLITNIIKRTPGYADGGIVGLDFSGGGVDKLGNQKTSTSSRGSSGPKPVVTYIIDGHIYTSLTAAKNALHSAFKAQAALGLKIDSKDLVKFRSAVKGTVDQAHTAFLTVYNDLKKLGVSSNFSAGLAREEAALEKQIGLRDRAADQLAAVKEKFNDMSSTIRSAVTGTFDVTTAGAGFDGNQAVTGQNILAQQKQAEVRARLFVKDIKALAGKIGNTYLTQLASKGPDALPEAQALLSLSAADLKTYNAGNADLSALGGDLGKFVGTRDYGAQITKLTKTEQAAAAKVQHDALLIATQTRDAVRQLKDRPITVITKIDGKVVSRTTQTGDNKNARR